MLSVSPPGPQVAVSSVFEVTFSEEIATRRLEEIVDWAVLARRVEVDDAFLSDIENPPLIESRQRDTEPVQLEWDGTRTVLTVTPLNTLAPATAYALVVSADVRDTSGNPLVGAENAKANFVYEVVSDAGPPQIVTTTASGTVPPNLKRVRVVFNQPVVGVSRETLRLEAQEQGGQDPAVAAVEIAPTRDEAVIVLEDPANGCERFVPQAGYRLRVAPGIADDAGRGMPEQEFTFFAGGACDLTPNQVLGSEGYAYDDTAFVFFATTKPSTTAMRYGRQGQPEDCEGNPCPVVGADARVSSDGIYLHELTVEGLTLGETYRYTFYAEDDLGNVASRSGTFIVVSLADISVNEILPNPAGDEEKGEYIELANFDNNEPVDLAGWALQVEDKAPCVFPVSTAPVVPPGGFLVVARSTFDPGLYPGLDPNVVYTPDDDPKEAGEECTSSALTLSNAVQTVKLLDDAGRPVSVYPGNPALNPTNTHEGESIDRIAPEEPDIAASFCFPNGPPSPGATNSSVIYGCQ